MKTQQQFSSAQTSINSKKVPAVFKQIHWAPETKNLDWGGGKFDTATEYLQKLSVENFIYDPFNRTKEHNDQIGPTSSYDTATISNVLNVIQEGSIRHETVKQVLNFIKPNGTIYIKVYEGDRSGAGRQTKSGCWQCNMKTVDYIEELKEFKPVLEHGIIKIIKN